MLLVDFPERGATINTAIYVVTPERLQAATRRRCPGSLTKDVLLFHDKIRPHAASGRTWTIRRIVPDLAPRDVRLFPDLKGHPGGHRF